MRIGIDIDDTTFKTIDSMIKYADKYNTEIGNKSPNNDNYGLIKNRYYLKELYGWDDVTKEAFFVKYYKKVLENCVPLPNASDIINKLKNEGNTIYFITARIEGFRNCNTKKITENSLEKYHINYDSLNLGIKDKLKFCKEHKIDLMIEDSYETCCELEENGINALLMTTIMNKNIDSSKIKRVYTWNDVYQEITNIRR